MMFFELNGLIVCTSKMPTGGIMMFQGVIVGAGK